MFHKAKHYFFFLVFCIASSVTDVYAQQQDFIVSRIEHSQLVKRNIHAIVQDSTGFMWFATDNGLLRFDGTNVVTFTHDPDDPTSLPANLVQAVHVDHNGDLWVGTTRGALSLYHPETGTFEHFKPTEDVNEIRIIRGGSDNTLWVGCINQPYVYSFSLSSKTFTAIRLPVVDTRSEYFAMDILERSNGELWIASVEDGVIVMSQDDQLLANYRHIPGNNNSIIGNSLRRITEDQNGNIWIAGFGAFISRFDPETERFESPAITWYNRLNNVYDLWVDEGSKTIWAAADGGLVRIDQQTLEITELYGFNPLNPRSLINDRPRSIFHASNNIFWIGNEHGGVHTFLQRYAFTHVSPEPGEADYLQHRTVRNFYQYNDSTMWVTNDLDLVLININTNKVIDRISALPGMGAEDGFTVMEKLPNGNYLIGTWGGGLILYNQRSGAERFFRYNPQDPTTISDNRVQFIYRDSKDRYWVGTENGLNLMNIQTGRFERRLYDSEASLASFPYSLQSTAFLEDDNDIFWIGTWRGMIRYDAATNSYTRILSTERNPRALSSNHILSIHKCDDGYLWLGTFSGGLSRYNPDDESFITFTDTDGLASSVIFTIVPGINNDIWLSSNSGLIRFNTQTFDFQNFTESDGLFVNDFWWGAGYRARNGNIYFGSIFGFITFNPEDIKENSFNPPVVLSEIRLFERVHLPSNKVSLRHFENYLSFTYAALDFTNPLRNEYMHMLEGLDNDWIFTGNRSQASYSAIPPGEYIFRVRGTNSAGIWSTNELAIPITIAPPFWKTMPFYFLSVFAIFIAVAGTIKWQTDKVKKLNKMLEAQVTERTRDLARKKEELSARNAELKEKTESLEERNREIEKQKNLILRNSNELETKNAQLERLNREKNSLIGIVAHDLRSPLASVISGLQVIRMSPDMPREEIDEIHNMMESYIEKQLAMISRILDHQSMETGNIKMDIIQQSILPIITNVINTHEFKAENKQLSIRLIKPPILPDLPIDQNMMEQVFDNLMSNAIKFSNPGGVISVTVLDTPTEIWTGIRDNGPGLSEDDKSKLFGKFQKLSARPTGGEQSTGLGLSIVKQFVNAMGGRVWADGLPGEGATFWVAIPKRDLSSETPE